VLFLFSFFVSLLLCIYSSYPCQMWYVSRRTGSFEPKSLSQDGFSTGVSNQSQFLNRPTAPHCKPFYLFSDRCRPKWVIRNLYLFEGKLSPRSHDPIISDLNPNSWPILSRWPSGVVGAQMQYGLPLQLSVPFWPLMTSQIKVEWDDSVLLARNLRLISKTPIRISTSAIICFPILPKRTRKRSILLFFASRLRSIDVESSWDYRTMSWNKSSLCLPQPSS
jgi:hypothetical protein